MRKYIAVIIILITSLFIYACSSSDGNSTETDTTAKWGSAKWGEHRWNQ